MRFEILQHFPNQVGTSFEVVVAPFSVVPNRGIGVRTGRKPQHDLGSILADG